ncbi:hypothetical protein [Streptomyces sp. NPDC001933]|uniref:hypothetical protein n=1 Tax=Streptomyces sp. NPDC001933 TaxID=3364626 RepID=UPI0036CE5181
MGDEKNGWGPFEDLGAPADTAPFLAVAGDGRVGVYYIGPDKDVTYFGQNPDRSGWTAPASTGASLRRYPVVAQFQDGRPLIFLIGTDGALWHVWTDAQGPEGFKAIDTFGGGNAASIAVTRGRDGRLAFFHANTAGEVYVIRETAPSAGWGTSPSRSTAVMTSPPPPSPTGGSLSSPPLTAGPASMSRNPPAALGHRPWR